MDDENYFTNSDNESVSSEENYTGKEINKLDKNKKIKIEGVDDDEDDVDEYDDEDVDDEEEDVELRQIGGADDLGNSEDEKEEKEEDDDDDDEEDIEAEQEAEQEEEEEEQEEQKNKSKKLKQIPLNSLYNNDEDDEEDNDDGEIYLKKFDKDIQQNYIMDFHPECVFHNYDEIEVLTNVVRDKDGIIIDQLHRTIPYLTKYEKTRILGQRAKQIDSGATAFVKVPENVIEGYLIAMLELQQKRIPFIIRRPLPNGGSEYWNVKDLENISF